MNSIFLTQSNAFLMGPIAKVLGFLLNAIYDMFAAIGIENVALCIATFTVLINLFMVPSNLKSQKASRVQSFVAPEMQKIQEKYKGKKDEVSMQKQQMEMQALYDKYGISPTSGCLPLLITFPIMIAMYTVIGAIPAYITEVHKLYEPIAAGIQATEGYIPILAEYATTLKIAIKGVDWAEATSINLNQVIDVLSKFTETQWISLQSQFPAIAQVIAVNSEKIMHINSFLFGLNIVQAPGFHFPGILIPIFSIVTQWVQQSTMSGTTKKGENKTVDTMNVYMKIMPLFSGFICLTLPIGIGIYWIVGNLFRIVQQLIFNWHMKDMDIDAIIEKNREKAEKKQEKRKEQAGAIEAYSKQRTSTISTYAHAADSQEKLTNNNQGKNSRAQSTAGKKTGEEKITPGGIASYAHLLDQRNKEE